MSTASLQAGGAQWMNDLVDELISTGELPESAAIASINGAVTITLADGTTYETTWSYGEDPN